MRNLVLRIVTGLAAALVSGLAVALAWASATQRATTEQDRMLLACLSVVFVLAVHLLPALRRRIHALVLWPVWLLCLALAGFGHASWFYLAGQSAAEVRTAGSAAAHAVAQERAAIEQALAGIKARPVSTVAAQLARTSDPDKRESLAAELAEARRAAGLNDRLIVLSRNAPGTGQEQSGTPEVETGTVTSTGVTLVMSVVAALLLEVLGALLWSAALAGDDDAAVPAQARAETVQAVVQQVVNVMAPIIARPVLADGSHVVDELADLRAAIERGDCRPSVRGIRDYMGCGMDRASHLRRQLIDR